MSKNRSFVRLTQRRAIRKADEFTLRADEVGTLRGFINTDHIEFGQVVTAAGGCGLACLLPSNLQRN